MGAKKIKYGIVGVGYLGKFHLKHLLNIEEVELVGLYDTNIDQATKISEEFNVHNFLSIDDLLKNVDAVSIVTPTISHMEVALKALDYNCHIFIEKPIANTLANGSKILKTVKEKKQVAHVGHIERFNPAFQEFMKEKNQPLFLECHRLTKLNDRSMDISVVLDLMIHDIDLVLHMIQSPIKEIIADGINVIKNSVDLANTKLIFENGCVVNLTASRISNKDMRKIRVFEKNCYSNIDLLNKKLTKHYANYNNTDNKFNFKKEELDVIKHDALQMELIHFCDTIINKKTELENITKSVEALQIAEQINEIINNKINA